MGVLSRPAGFPDSLVPGATGWRPVAARPLRYDPRLHAHVRCPDATPVLNPLSRFCFGRQSLFPASILLQASIRLQASIAIPFVDFGWSGQLPFRMSDLWFEPQADAFSAPPSSLQRTE